MYNYNENNKEEQISEENKYAIITDFIKFVFDFRSCCLW